MPCIKISVIFDFRDDVDECASNIVHVEDDGQEFLQCILQNPHKIEYCSSCQTKLHFNIDGNMNKIARIQMGDGQPMESCKYFIFDEINSFFLNARHIWNAGICHSK